MDSASTTTAGSAVNPPHFLLRHVPAGLLQLPWPAPMATADLPIRRGRELPRRHRRRAAVDIATRLCRKATRPTAAATTGSRRPPDLLQPVRSQFAPLASQRTRRRNVAERAESHLPDRSRGQTDLDAVIADRYCSAPRRSFGSRNGLPRPHRVVDLKAFSTWHVERKDAPRGHDLARAGPERGENRIASRDAKRNLAMKRVSSPPSSCRVGRLPDLAAGHQSVSAHPPFRRRPPCGLVVPGDQFYPMVSRAWWAQCRRVVRCRRRHRL